MKYIAKKFGSLLLTLLLVSFLSFFAFSVIPGDAAKSQLGTEATPERIVTGNPYAHAILRGYVDKFGRNIPNYHYEDLQNLLEHYEDVNASQQTTLANPAVIVDTNHSNSGKQFMEQIRISKDVLHSCKVSKEIHNLVKGLMIESYIEDGAQKVSEHCYGKSITDPCLGWEKTEKLIYELADLW